MPLSSSSAAPEAATQQPASSNCAAVPPSVLHDSNGQLSTTNNLPSMQMPTNNNSSGKLKERGGEKSLLPSSSSSSKKTSATGFNYLFTINKEPPGEIVAAVSSPMTMRRFRNCNKIGSKHIDRYQEEVAASSEDMSLPFDAMAEARRRNVPRSVAKGTSAVASKASADDLSTVQQKSSNYLDDSFPTLKHAISKLSTAASLGSESASDRDDDFDDEDIGDAFCTESKGAVSNAGDHSLNMIDEMTNMHIKAAERRMVLSPDRSDLAFMSPNSTDQRCSSMAQKRCLSVSNVATIEQQMAYGFPTDVFTENLYKLDDPQSSLSTPKPGQSSIDVSHICESSFSSKNKTSSDLESAVAGNTKQLSSSPVSSSNSKGDKRTDYHKSYTATPLSVPKISIS